MSATERTGSAAVPWPRQGAGKGSSSGGQPFVVTMM